MIRLAEQIGAFGNSCRFRIHIEEYSLHMGPFTWLCHWCRYDPVSKRCVSRTGVPSESALCRDKSHRIRIHEQPVCNDFALDWAVLRGRIERKFRFWNRIRSRCVDGPENTAHEQGYEWVQKCCMNVDCVIHVRYLNQAGSTWADEGRWNRNFSSSGCSSHERL